MMKSRVLTNPLAWFVAGVLTAAFALQCGIVDVKSAPLTLTPYEEWKAQAYANGDATDLASYNIHVIRLVWPDHLENWAIRVARCESTLNANAINWAGPYVGLFQVWTGHGMSIAQLQEPIVNSQESYKLYLRQGPQAWPYCGRT